MCELFDSESSGTRNEVLATIDAAEAIRIDLDRYFTALTGVSLGSQPEAPLLEMLLPAVPVAQQAGYPATLEQFVESSAERLQRVLRDELESREIPLLHRPEAILVFERIANAPALITHTWLDHFPEADLDELKAVWGPA